MSASELKPCKVCGRNDVEIEQEVRAALLAYAAMVERCEKVIETYKGTVCEEFVDIANFVLKNDAGDFNEILLDKKGATDDSK